MSEELGKIEKPEVSSFKKDRRLLQVPLIYSGPESPSDYVEILGRYWQQASEQIDKLENRLGSITKVLHETLIIGGKEGLEMLARLNSHSHAIVSRKCNEGIGLECIEDRELLEEVMDWERCLITGLISQKVARQVYESYNAASHKRFELMGKAIDEKVRDGDVAILFIREGHLVQFPSDMDVFSVSPPALDELHRWAREKAVKKEPEQG